MEEFVKRVENIEVILGSNTNINPILSERIDCVYKLIESTINKISTFDTFFNKCKLFNFASSI